MAYDNTLLQRVGGGIGSGGKNQWVYGNTTDNLATVSGAGYFSDGIARGMRLHDLVDCIIGNVRKPGHISAVTATAATFTVAAIT